jgi:putative DNA primase/helicase
MSAFSNGSPDRDPGSAPHGPARVLESLMALPKARANQGRGKACCPAHDDRDPSLSWVLRGDGSVVPRCWAGCPVESVLAALGCTMADLAPSKVADGPEDAHGQSEGTFASGGHLRPREVAAYPYHGPDGTLRFEVVRYRPKEFRIRRPTGLGRWAWNLDGVEPVLYRLPDLLAAHGQPHFIVEGEKDAETLLSLGLSATTNPMGAGRWRPSYSACLQGERVIVVRDNDEPGHEHGLRVARSLNGIAAEVRILDLPDLPLHGDVTDWLEAGGTRDALLGCADAAPPFGPGPECEGISGAGEHGLIRISAIEPVAIDWFWYPYVPFGMLTGLYGDPGVGKSTIALALAARATTGGAMPDGSGGTGPMNVLVIAGEDPVGAVVRPRLDAAGADVERVFISLDRPFTIPDDLGWLEQAITDNDVRFLIIDVLIAFLSPDVNSYRDQDVRRALAPLQAIAGRTGAAILALGHLSKSDRAAIYRVGGSIGIVGAYRACLIAAADPGQDACVLAPLKASLTRLPSAIGYRIDDVGGVGAVTWLGTTTRTADALLAATGDAADAGPLDDAIEFLREVLADGPMPVGAVM